MSGSVGPFIADKSHDNSSGEPIIAIRDSCVRVCMTLIGRFRDGPITSSTSAKFPADTYVAVSAAASRFMSTLFQESASGPMRQASPTPPVAIAAAPYLRAQGKDTWEWAY